MIDFCKKTDNARCIGIIVAMKKEGDDLIALLSDAQTETVSGATYHSGYLNGNRVVITVGGVGKVFAAVAAEVMILRYCVSEILNVGVAGALHDGFHLFDVAVIRSVVQHDMDTSAVGDPKGMISGINVIEIASDGSMTERLQGAVRRVGKTPISSSLASGDTFIADPARKAEIVAAFHSDVCDMEGAAIGQVCYINGIPFAEVKVISDGADGDPSLDYATFAAAAAKIGVEIASAFVGATSGE